MKPLTLGAIVLCMLCGVLPVHAQAVERNVDFGVKVGASFTNLVTSAGGAGEGRTGLNAGVFLRAPLNVWSDLYVEAAFHQKGGRGAVIMPPDEDEPYSRFVGVDYRFDFVSTYVAGRAYSTFEGSGIELYGLLGPRVDLLVGKRFVAADGTDLSDQEERSDHAGLVLGYGVGVGVDLSGVLPVPLLVEFRFNGDVTEAREDVRHRTLDLRVGVGF